MTITPVEAAWGTKEVLPSLSERTWRGTSGVLYSGEVLARHLEAARDLLAAKGWAPVREEGRCQLVKVGEDGARTPVDGHGIMGRHLDGLEAIDDTTSIRSMLVMAIKAVVSWARLEYGTEIDIVYGRHTLFQALNPGSGDLGWVAGRVVDAVLAARLGATSANCHLWSESPGVTAGDVLDLLTVSAAVARANGPA